MAKRCILIMLHEILHLIEIFAIIFLIFTHGHNNIFIKAVMNIVIDINKHLDKLCNLYREEPPEANKDNENKL